MSKDPSTRYIATVNGVNVGSFPSIVAAHNAAMLAIGSGVAGPHVMNGPGRLLEVRDTHNAYQICESNRY